MCDIEGWPFRVSRYSPTHTHTHTRVYTGECTRQRGSSRFERPPLFSRILSRPLRGPFSWAPTILYPQHTHRYRHTRIHTIYPSLPCCSQNTLFERDIHSTRGISLRFSRKLIFNRAAPQRRLGELHETIEREIVQRERERLAAYIQYIYVSLPPALLRHLSGLTYIL